MSFLSKIIYRKKEYSEKIIKNSAILVGVFGSLYYIIGFLSLFILYWNNLIIIIIVLILLVLFIMHLILSFLYLCPNCLNKKKCPMAKVSKAIGKD